MRKKRKLKVLLLGEFSGVHNNLKVGLNELGIEATLANLGDGYKKFSTDISLTLSEKNILSKYINILYKKWMILKMMKYDVIQFIHPNVLYDAGYSVKDIYRLLKGVKLSVCLLCGCDNTFYENCNTVCPKLCEECQKIDRNWKKCSFDKRINLEYISYEKKFYELVDRLVPLAWEYDYVYRTCLKKYNNKLTSMIPMPLDINQYLPSYVKNDVVKVYHPLNRRGFKGTQEIEKVFGSLQVKNSGKAEYLIKGKMPINEFNRLLEQQDIVVDQAYFSTIGMTALYAMAQRKVVVTGFQSDKLDYEKYPHLKELPKVDLGTTVEEMVEVIGDLVSNKEKIEQLKDAGRAYVEKYHDSKKVAKRFLRMYMGKD